jgi:uncharacterized SAM-binding protein YcdF (DUF218 family)
VRADAIVVLGCRVTPSGRPGQPLARRVARAAEALRDGAAPVVIVSGGRRWGQHVEARVMRRELLAHGASDDAILEEMCSLSTCENAIFTSAILRRLAARTAFVVTCSWHLDRALASFRSVGVDAIGLPAFPPPLGPLDRARIEAHEAVCRPLDASAVARGAVLRELAAGFAGARV